MPGGHAAGGKARKALEALKKLTSPQTIVIREGIRQEIPAAELVTGDLVRPGGRGHRYLRIYG